MLLCLAILLLALPAPAEACSCGVFDRPTAESCRGSKRAFAGTVAAYRWPTAYDEALRSVIRSPLVEVELAIDRVWRGDVPSTLVGVTGHGGGDCGIHPVPGTRFVVCDDEAAGDPPGYNFCSRPAFEDPVLEAALGPSSEPARSFWRPRPVWWREPLLVPLIAVALFALLGRAMRPVATEPLRYPRLLLALIACAGAVIAIRAIAHVAKLPLLAGFGPVVLAVIVGAGVAVQGQRTPSRFGGALRGLAAAVAFAALPVSLGYAPLHLPWNQEAAVACSRQRAEAILSRDEPLEIALAREPYACTDLGTQRYRIIHERCLLFPDGDGGEYAVCREDGVTSTFIGPER